MHFHVYDNGVQIGALDADDEEAARAELRQPRVFGEAEAEIDVRPAEGSE